MHSFAHAEANPYQQLCERQNAWRSALLSGRPRNFSDQNLCSTRAGNPCAFGTESIYEINALPDLFIVNADGRRPFSTASLHDLAKLPPISAASNQQAPGGLPAKSPLVVSPYSSETDLDVEPNAHPLAPQTATLNKHAFGENSIYEIKNHPNLFGGSQPQASQSDAEPIVDGVSRTNSIMELNQLPDIFSKFHDDAYTVVPTVRQPSATTLNKELRRACSVADITQMPNLFSGVAPSGNVLVVRAPSDVTLNKYLVSAQSEHDMNLSTSGTHSVYEGRQRQFRDFSRQSLEELSNIPPISWNETAYGFTPRNSSSRMEYFPGMQNAQPK